MTDIKTIALDMDGTLYDREHNIQEKTKKALIELQDRGIEIILASGRPINGMLEIAEELEMDKHHGIIISNNGAVAYDVRNNKTIFDRPIKKEHIKEILENNKKYDIPAMIQKDNYMLVENVYDGVVDSGDLGKGVINIIEWEARNGNFLLKEVESLVDAIDFPVNKILTIVEPEFLKNNMKDIIKPLKGKLHIVPTTTFYLEYTNLGVNKASALKKLGVDRETLMSFGDSLNDKEMIEYAKYGVAMSNGAEEVKEVADYITGDRDDEGIYNALKHYGLIH